MRVAIGSDHAGVAYKAALVDLLRDLGHDVKDFGPSSEEPVDYPHYIRPPPPPAPPGRGGGLAGAAARPAARRRPRRPPRERPAGRDRPPSPHRDGPRLSGHRRGRR